MFSHANRILAALTPEEQDRLQPHLSGVRVDEGEVLLGDSRPVAYAYFPTTAIVAHLCSTSSGESINVAATGADGVVGLSFAWGNWSPGRAVVERAGHAWRLSTSALRLEFAMGGSLQLQALRYQQLLMLQMAQTALCSRLHRVDQQLCRWILTHLDEGQDRITVTQQQVARMLGVRREAVSLATTRLEAADVLRWARGRVRVLDQRALEARSCECYQVLRGHAQHLFPLMPRAA